MRKTDYSHLHPFREDDDYFVLNVHTLRLHRINEPLYGILSGAIPPHLSEEEIGAHERMLRECEGLKSGPDPGKNFQCQKKPRYSTLDLQVAHLCNLKCAYCYAQGGNFGGEDRQMSKERARQALDFFFLHAESDGPLQISYDGGEPLTNFEVIRDSSIYAKEQGGNRGFRLSFTVGTNGTLVTDEIAHHFETFNFSPQISMDGPKEIHDQLRPYRDNKGSYDSLMAGIATFTRNGVRLASRITLTPKNLNLKEQVEQLHNLGAIRIAAFPASGIGGEYAFQEENLEVLRQEYKKTAGYILDTLFGEGKVVRFANLTESLDLIHNAQIKHYGCAAGRGFFSVNPEGNLYPCHRLVGNPEFLLGTLEQGFTTAKTEEILRNHVDSRDICRDCWARYLCGGGCMAEAYFANRDIKTPFSISCEIYKMEMEISCWMYSRILEHDRTLLDRFCT